MFPWIRQVAASEWMQDVEGHRTYGSKKHAAVAEAHCDDVRSLLGLILLCFPQDLTRVQCARVMALQLQF